MLLRAITTLALISAATIGTAAPASQQETAVVRQAEELLVAGDRAAALRLAEQVVARQPFNVEAHHLIQRIYRGRDDGAALLARYRELAQRYPGVAAAQYLLGNALLSIDGRDAARPYFDRALQLDPRFGWAASINAILNQYEGNSVEALRLGRISVEEIADDVMTAAIYADLLRMNGLRQEAIRFLQGAAATHPDQPRYLIELWSLWVRGVDDPAAARAQFAAQLAANRGRFFDTPEHAALLAGFYRSVAMANPEAARRTFLELAARFPEAPEAREALLEAAGLTRDPEAKIDLYHRILDEYPEAPIRYAVYYRMLRELIGMEAYDRAIDLARRLTTEPDPGRGDGTRTRFEGSTEWGYTLAGIGYAGWFAAAQAEARAGDPVFRSFSVRHLIIDRPEKPISPDALVAARALEASACNDPRSLTYVGRELLDSSYHRILGIRLVERAARAAAGADPLVELAYGGEELERVRAELDTLLARMPYYYVEAGMLAEAERAVEELLAAFDGDRVSYRYAEINFLAGHVFERVGRYRDAARHFLIGHWASPSTDGYDARLGELYGRLATSDIRRYDPTTAPRRPLAAAGIRAEGNAPLDGERFGGDLLLILLWGPWSERSVALLRALDAASPELLESGVSTLAVAVQEPASPYILARGGTAFTRFRSRYPLDHLPLARAELAFIDRIDLIGVPTTLLLDASGRVLARQMSFAVEPEGWLAAWRAVIAELVHERP